MGEMMGNTLDYKVDTQNVKQAVAQIQEAFAKKRALEKAIVCLIKDYENETGLAIDSIRYQRDITLPLKSARYTDLSILISAEEQ